MDASRFDIRFFDSVSSTQILAREAHAPTGMVIATDEQTAGYGRRGREWQSPKGNLYFTLIEEFNPAHIAWLGYAMGLGLYDALAPHTDKHLALKWPNDLLLDQGKLSGMLLEVVDDKILIGVGINLKHAPNSDQKTAALPVQTDALHILQAILYHYDKWRLVALQSGFSGLRETWLERAVWLNDLVTAKLANGTVLEGKFIDLDASGALVIDVKGEHHTVTSADIYLKTQ